MDYTALRAEMVLKHVSQDDLLKHLEISRSSFYRKMNGLTEFTHDEIGKIIELLNLSSDRAMSIFFADRVS